MPKQRVPEIDFGLWVIKELPGLVVGQFENEKENRNA